jgi:hypothetical protein
MVEEARARNARPMDHLDALADKDWLGIVVTDLLIAETS